MSKLEWTYMDDGSYIAHHAGLTIHAQLDPSASNPIENDEGSWPMHVSTGRNDIKTYGESLDHPLAAFSDELLVHDQITIGKILDITIEDLMQGHDFNNKPSKYCHDAAVLRAGFEDRFDVMVDSARDSEVADLWRLTGATVLKTTITGYSQGDWADVMIVATKAKAAEFGCTEPITEAQLQGQVDTYKAWAYGDCFGYVITTPDGEELDSCWGYYGSDHDESGLEEAAIQSAMHHAQLTHRRRLDKLKTLIRQRVPLDRRPALLLAA